MLMREKAADATHYNQLLSSISVRNFFVNISHDHEIIGVTLSYAFKKFAHVRWMLSECKVTLIRAGRIIASLLLAFNMDNSNYPEQKGTTDTNIHIVLQHVTATSCWLWPRKISDLTSSLITYYSLFILNLLDLRHSLHHNIPRLHLIIIIIIFNINTNVWLEH